MSKDTPEPGFQHALRTLQQERANRTAIVLALMLLGVGSVIGAYFYGKHTDRQAIRDAVPAFQTTLEDYLRCTLDTPTLPEDPAQALTALALKDKHIGRRFYRTCQRSVWQGFTESSLHLPEPRSKKRSWFSTLMKNLFGTPPKDHYATFRKLVEFHHTRYLPSSEPHLMCRDFNLIHKTVRDLAIEYDTAFTLPELACLEHAQPPPSPSMPALDPASIVGTPSTLGGRDPHFSNSFWSRGKLWLTLEMNQVDLPEAERHPSTKGDQYRLIFHTRPDKLPRWDRFAFLGAPPLLIEEDAGLFWTLPRDPRHLLVLEGDNWRQAAPLPDEGHPFAFRQGKPGAWWVLTLDDEGRFQALRSTDKGATLQKIGEPVQGPGQLTQNARSTFHLPDGGHFTTLIWDNRGGTTFFALHLDPSGTWHTFTDQQPSPGEGYFQACSDGPHLRALTPTGAIYASDDTGRVWRKLTQLTWRPKDPQIACFGPKLLLVGSNPRQDDGAKSAHPLYHALCDAGGCGEARHLADSAHKWALTSVGRSAHLLIDFANQDVHAVLVALDPSRGESTVLKTFSHHTLTDDVAILDGHIFASDYAQDYRRF